MRPEFLCAPLCPLWCALFILLGSATLLGQGLSRDEIIHRAEAAGLKPGPQAECLSGEALGRYCIARYFHHRCQKEVWSVSNTEGGSRDRPHGRTFLFDAATGKLLEKTRWSAIIDRLPPNPR